MLGGVTIKALSCEMKVVIHRNVRLVSFSLQKTQNEKLTHESLDIVIVAADNSTIMCSGHRMKIRLQGLKICLQGLKRNFILLCVMCTLYV